MARRSLNTHRRSMRPQTPVLRATRGTVGVAFAASFVFAGTNAAVADDTQVEAAPEAAPVIAPSVVKTVDIPVVKAEDDSAFGTFAVSDARIKPAPEAPEVEEAPAEEATTSTSRGESASTSGENSSTERSSSQRSASNEGSRGSSESRSSQRTADSSGEAKAAKKKEAKKQSAPKQAAAGSSIVATAKNGIGVRYVSGGNTPAGWDCSGFVQWVYAQHGISLPRTSGAQAASAKRISASEARPGDLVYYPGHIGIYMGNGKILDAGNKRASTSIRTMWNANWSYYRVG